MDDVLAIRPFVPAKDHARSRAYYEALGFRATHVDGGIAILKLGSFSIILQDFYKQELAENLMVQMLVRDVAAWWERHEPARVAAQFDLREVKSPAIQPWGLKVGFLFDPSGVLWHVAEAPF